MLEQFLKLLERFVVAHELIAANSVKQPVYELKADVNIADSVRDVVVKEVTKEIPVEGEDTVDTKPAEEEKPKRKPRKAKVEEPTPEPEEEKEEVDYQSLRDQIQAIDDAINEGPSDAACDDSDELLEEFTGKKMKIAAIKDEDLAEYLERLTAIKNKYFEEE
ncbi:13.88 kDa late protein [Escherichia phage SZH-1]|uniref:13.88 kDa late protein n=1 Tax=Escherichia phage SZH-1 TaxID=2945916 RepID=UPI00218855BE|nr:13.88 kDa late protein [Escherichia phage SZH-1]URG18169.1 13.88 kDa late protein [Escherichia phage SZH-1]